MTAPNTVEIPSTPSVSPGGEPRRILIVDDEPELSEAVAWRLEQSGYRVTAVSDGLRALESIREDPPDAVLLDLVLPSLGGMEVLREIRRWSTDLPVILVSGRSEEADRVVGLELGADDFVVKPFSPRELVARIGTVLRRSDRTPPPSDDRFSRFADLVIDREAHRVTVDGEEVQLSSKEYALLMVLADSPDRAFSRDELIDLVWPGTNAAKPDATLTEHMSRLRRKIESDPANPRRLVTVRGLGYRFSP